MFEVELTNSTEESLSYPAGMASVLVMAEVNTKESQKHTKKPPSSIKEWKFRRSGLEI